MHCVENCSVCVHGEDTKDRKVECTIDNEVHERNYRCSMFKHILDD